MAKSVKQQMYEQLANQHVQQALNNIGMQKFEEAYNQWNAEQDGLAEFQAAYNAWNEANPVEAPQQPIQTMKAPVQQSVQEATVPVLNTPKATTSSTAINSQASKKIDGRAFNEDYAKQQQEEQALAGKARTKEESRRQFQKAYNTEDYFRQQQEEQIQAEKGVDWKDFFKKIYPNATQPVVENEQPTVSNEVLQQYAEKKGVSIEEARKDFEKAEAMKNQSIEAPGAIDTESTTAAHGAWLEDQRRANQRQQTNYESFLNGMGNAVTAPISGPIRLAGAATGNNWDPVPERSREEYRNATEQNPVATMAGNLAGMLLLAKGVNAGGAGSTSAGAAMKAAEEDALINGATKAEALKHGIGIAGRQLAANTAAQMPFDLATDIIPTLANDVAEGKSSKEIIANTLLNTLINGGFNAIGDVASIAKTAKTGLPTLTAATKQMDLPTITNEGELVDDINKQFNNFMADYQPTFKDDSAMRNVFTPEDLDNIQNAQFRQLMEENLIPERLNPVAEMEMPEDVLGTNEIKALSNEYGNMWGSADVPKLAQPEAPKADIPQVETPKVDAETLAKQMDAEEIAAKQTDEVVKPQRRPVTEVDNPRLTDEERDFINGGLFELENPLRDPKVDKAVNNLYAAVKSNEGANLVIKYSDLSAALRKSTDADEAEAIVKELANLKKSVNSIDAADKAIVKDILDYNDIENAIADYKMALNGEDRAAVESAAKALDAARNRIARRKGADPVLKKTFGGDYGPKVKRPLNNFPYSDVTEEDLDDIVNGWIESEMSKPNRYVKDAEPDSVLHPEKAASGQSNPGQYKMQFFADGEAPKEEWATSKFKTNTDAKTGWVKDESADPISDYSYRKYSEAEQWEDAAANNLSAEDLIYKDQFDPSDVKQAMKLRQELLLSKTDKESLRKANRLGRKIAFETREGGRLPQALAEFTRTTPEGQLRYAQQALDDIVDKKVGAGTSEALDNLVEMIEKAFDDFGNDKEAFSKKVSELLEANLRSYANGKAGTKMSPKSIKGKNKILKMIERGADIEDIADVVYKQNGGVKLTGEENAEIYNLLQQAKDLPEGSYEQEEVLARAAKIAVGRAPSTFGQKLRSVLYTNMLGNFKTAFSRNAMGNAVYQTLEQGRAPIAAAVDKLVSLKTGKHSTLGWNKGKRNAYLQGLKQGAVDQAKDMWKHIDTGRNGAKGWEMALANNASTFNDSTKIGKLANGVEYYVRNAMEMGDRPFYEANYRQAYTELQQMIDRYGKDAVAGLEGIDDKDLPQVMDMIASFRAADSVFQKHGAVSKGLTDIRNGLGKLSEGVLGVDVLSTAASPFTMTPGNMLQRAIEYTPLGIAKNAAETIKEVAGKKGFNQRRFVDEASRTIAGVPILLGTTALAKNGVINGGFSTDPDEKQAQIEDGYTEYGFNVPDVVPYYGGKTLDTSDWPVIGPMMQAGAAYAENGLTPEASLQAAEAVVGGAATQGLRKAFGADSSSWSGNDSLVNNLINTVGSSATQLVPSLVRQTAQTTDEYKRDLGEYGTKEYYLNNVLNSIPGLRETLPVKYNVEGEPVLQNQGRSMGAKILENYVLPMNVSEYTPSGLNEEASRLRQSTGDAYGFAPKAKRSDLRSWDEAANIEYSEEQFRKYKEQLGSANSEVGNALLDSKYYSKLNDTEKNKALQDAYSAVKAATKNKLTGAETDDKLAKAYLDDGTKGLIKEMTIKGALKSADVPDTETARLVYDNLGETGLKKYSLYKKRLDGSTASEDIQKVLDSSGMLKSDKAKYYSYLNTSASPGANPYDYVPGINYKPEKDKSYQKAKSEFPTLKPVDYYKTKDQVDAMGEANNSITQQELVDYMNANNVSANDMMKYWTAYGQANWKKVPYLQGNTWVLPKK